MDSFLRRAMMELERIRPTSRDRLCLQFVAEQSFATIDQLWQFAWPSLKNSDYTYDRVLSLERSGYLKQVKVEGISHKVLTVTLKGRNLVASALSFPIPERGGPIDIARHQLDLNELRLTFLRRGVDSWRSAECLGVDPSFSKIGDRHTPDAFYVTSRGLRVAIEYDRTLRKKDRIKERLSAYLAELMSPDRAIDRLIYLVAPAYLKTYQQIFDESFSGVRGSFILTTMNDFFKQLEGEQ